jgi:hypothetical protein
MKLVVFTVVTLFTSCVSDRRPWLHPFKPTTTVGSLTYCRKHHIPLISVVGYHSENGPEKIVLVHSAEPLAHVCDDDCPNAMWDDCALKRTELHPVRRVITFCLSCTVEWWNCISGYRQLDDADLQQITSLILRDPKFRKPVIRVFGGVRGSVGAVGGRAEQAGDVFAVVGLKKHHGKWRFDSPVSSHRVVAVGQSLW